MCRVGVVSKEVPSLRLVVSKSTNATSRVMCRNVEYVPIFVSMSPNPMSRIRILRVYGVFFIGVSRLVGSLLSMGDDSYTKDGGLLFLFVNVSVFPFASHVDPSGYTMVISYIVRPIPIVGLGRSNDAKGDFKVPFSN